jgi:hypothetical protein
MMLGEWLTDLESLEAISQDDDTRALVLRLAAMSRAGTLQRFLTELRGDRDVDAETRASFAELASDESFLLAVEDYVDRTRVSH